MTTPVTDSDAADYAVSPDVVVPVPISLPAEVLDAGLRTSPQAAGFGAWTAYPLAGTERPFPLLPFDDARSRALIVVAEPAGANAPSFNPTPGQATNPGPFTTIVSQFLPAGTYTANWEVMLRGTLTATDADNFQMFIGGTLIATSNNALNVGTVYAQEPVVFNVPAGGGFLTITNVNANAAAVYQAGVVLTPDSGGLVYVGTQAQCQASPPLGGQLPAGAVVEVRNQQALWLVPDGSHPMVVSVLAERYEVATRAHGAG